MIFTRFFSRRRQATATPDIAKPSSEGEGPRYLQAYRRLTNLEELRALAQGLSLIHISEPTRPY